MVKCQVVKGVDDVKLVVTICRGKHVRSSTVPELVHPERNFDRHVEPAATCSHHSRMRPWFGPFAYELLQDRVLDNAEMNKGSDQDEVEELPGAVGKLCGRRSCK